MKLTVAYKVIHAFADIDIHENAGDFKLLSRNAVHNPETRRARSLSERLVCVDRIQARKGILRAECTAFRRKKFSLFNSLNPYKEFIRGITSFSASRCISR